jgi:hypothetical protein
MEGNLERRTEQKQSTIGEEVSSAAAAQTVANTIGDGSWFACKAGAVLCGGVQDVWWREWVSQRRRRLAFHSCVYVIFPFF